MIDPVGLRKIETVCKVQIPALPYHEEAPLAFDDLLNRRHEIMREDDIAICIANDIMARHPLSFRKKIVDEWCAEFIQGYIRNVAETELLGSFRCSMPIATQDDLTGWTELKPTGDCIPLDNRNVTLEGFAVCKDGEHLRYLRLFKSSLFEKGVRREYHGWLPITHWNNSVAV